MRIAVVGATGWLGGTIAREALGRGHEVTRIAGSADKLAAIDASGGVVADATDASSIGAAITGHDAVLVAVTDRSGPDRNTIPAAAKAVIAGVPAAGVPRVLFIAAAVVDELEQHRFPRQRFTVGY